MASDADKALLEELAGLHEEYMGKMRELEKRQKDLMRRIIERIDSENAAKLLEDINNDQETSESSETV